MGVNMPPERTSDSKNTTLIDNFREGWQVIPDLHKRILKIGVVLLFGTAIIAPIALVLLYLIEYTGSLNHLFSAIIGFEMGAVLLIVFGFSGFAVLLYNNNRPIIASTFLVFYAVLFGAFYWATFQVLTLELVPVLVGLAFSLVLTGVSELYSGL